MFPPELESTKYDGRPPKPKSWWHTPISRKGAFVHTVLAFSMVFEALCFILDAELWHYAVVPLSAVLIAARWRYAFDTPAWIYGAAAITAVLFPPPAWLRAG